MEADRRGALHNRVKEDLNTKVVADIKQWQKDSFHKVNNWCTWDVVVSCCNELTIKVASARTHIPGR